MEISVLNHIGGLTSLLSTHTLGTWIQLIPALISDLNLSLVKWAVIPEAK